MLPSSQRLTRQQVTDLLENKGLKVIFNRLGTLKYADSAKPRLAVVTGSKNQKKAVLRNRVRRQLYAFFRQYALEHKDISIEGLFYVSKQIYDMSFAELKTSLYALLQKVV